MGHGKSPVRRHGERGWWCLGPFRGNLLKDERFQDDRLAGGLRCADSGQEVVDFLFEGAGLFIQPFCSINHLG